MSRAFPAVGFKFELPKMRGLLHLKGQGDLVSVVIAPLRSHLHNPVMPIFTHLLSPHGLSSIVWRSEKDSVSWVYHVSATWHNIFTPNLWKPDLRGRWSSSENAGYTEFCVRDLCSFKNLGVSRKYATAGPLLHGPSASPCNPHIVFVGFLRTPSSLIWGGPPPARIRNGGRRITNDWDSWSSI